MTFDLRKHRAEAHGFGPLQENLRQIVYGGNDGIVTTFAVVAGFAGAQFEGVAEIGTLAVLLFGFANLFADATSMGLGAFLSARSQRDVYQSIRSQELVAIAECSQEEGQEVLAILADRGVSPSDAETLVAVLLRNPELMADFMMAYEFGLPLSEEDKPASNAVYTFVSFLIFGFIPILPYVFLPAEATTFYLSVCATLAALIGLGMLRWVATFERFLACLTETAVVGSVCAAVAYAVGLIVGSW